MPEVMNFHQFPFEIEEVQIKISGLDESLIKGGME